VVASSIGFLPELVQDGMTGRLVAPRVESFVAALEYLVRAPDSRSAMAQAAFDAAQRRFSPELQARRTLDLYERTVPGRACR